MGNRWELVEQPAVVLISIQPAILGLAVCNLLRNPPKPKRDLPLNLRFLLSSVFLNRHLSPQVAKIERCLHID